VENKKAYTTEVGTEEQNEREGEVCGKRIPGRRGYILVPQCKRERGRGGWGQGEAQRAEGEHGK